MKDNAMYINNIIELSEMGWTCFTTSLPPCCGSDSETAYISKEVFVLKTHKSKKNKIDINEDNFSLGVLFIYWTKPASLFIGNWVESVEISFKSIEDEEGGESEEFPDNYFWKEIEHFTK